MATTIDVEWDVDFWASRYPAGDLAVYNREFDNSPKEKLSNLWRWKSLNRAGYEQDKLLDYLDAAKDLCECVEGKTADSPLDGVTNAFLELRRQLRRGPLSENSYATVTPQFLLHLADSEGSYSGRFPILDIWVARAHRIHTADDASRTLQYGLYTREDPYRELIGYFFDRCENAAEVARLERALFVQGRAIGRYASLEGDFESTPQVPVTAARTYLDEIRRHISRG